MAKPKKTPAAAAPTAGDGPQDATTTDDGAGAEETSDDESEQQEEDNGPKVKALVLSDCIYGKCGEVMDFPADQVEAIAAAGYIDAHPNAIKSVEG